MEHLLRGVSLLMMFCLEVQKLCKYLPVYHLVLTTAARKYQQCCSGKGNTGVNRCRNWFIFVLIL